MVKLKEISNSNLIAPNQLEDGQIGVIRECEGMTCHTDKVVQRYGDNLLELGQPFGHQWSDMCRRESGTTMKIEVLPVGSLIEITE